MVNRITAALILSLCVCEILCAAEAGTTAPIEMIPGRKQLFLDDFVVQEMPGLRRTMHQPVKRGAVLKPDLRSDGALIQIRSAPMWVPGEGVYKLIYTGYTMEDHSQIGPALALSKDGIHWDKPIIGEIEVYGSKQNNRIVLDGGLRWPNNYFECVVYDPDDPDPSRRYKGLIGAEWRLPMVSADCIHWRTLDVPKITSGDESQLVYDREKRRFLAIVKSYTRFGRSASISISEDFIHWSAPRFLFSTDAEDQPLALEVIRKRLADSGLSRPMYVDPDPATGWKPPQGHQPVWRVECYNLAVFPYEGLYIGLPMMYYPTGLSLPARNNTDGFDQIQLMATRDLVNWTRLGDRQPFIGPSRIDGGLVGVFDRMQLAPTNRPVERGDELWFYYTGLKWRDSVYDLNSDGSKRDPATLSEKDRADVGEGWAAACLAVLRRDGFVSLDADEKGGFVLTKPLKLTGSRLFLNLDASNGQARVEILDDQNRPITDFSGSQSTGLRVNAVRLPVTWKSQSDLNTSNATPVRLKIHLNNARLYAFWTE